MEKPKNSLRQSAELFAKNIFDDPVFQKNWQEYLAAFGHDIADIFGDSYLSKVRFASVLKMLQNKNYEDAFRDLRAYVPENLTAEDNEILERLIRECEKNIPPQTYPPKSERYMRCREALLSHGFSEATQCYGNFLIPTTEKAAFIVNLDDEGHGINIVYGLASIAEMSGCEGWFAAHGVDNDTCQVRNITFVSSDGDEEKATREISDFYHQYKYLSKDEILALKKERQKIFLSHFARALKPLGFKKKGTKWTKSLGNGRAFTFEAQKSAYSDQYYFNSIIHSANDFYKTESVGRVVINNTDIYNWQLMSEEQIENLIQYILKNHIDPVIY